MSFRRKLLIALIFVALAPLAVFAWFAYTTAYDGLRDRILEQLWSFAKLEATRVADHIEQDRDRLALVCSRTQLRLSLAAHIKNADDTLVEKMERIMGDALGSIPKFERIAVADLDGTVLAATDKKMRGLDTSDPECFDVAKRGEYAHAFREETDDGGHLRIVLHGPMKLDGRQIGVGIVHANADALLGLLGQKTLGETEETILARRGKNARSLSPMLPLGTGSTIVDGEGQDLLNEGEERVVEDARDDSGRAVLAALAHVPNSDLCVIAKVDKLEALAPANNVRMMGLLAAACVMALILAAAAIIAKMIVRPVRELLTTASRIVEGDLDVRADITSDDEIGELASGFNAMTERLVHANRKLGQTVEERTEQLENTQMLLIQAEKLESLGRLAAGVAHEVKNPLYMIQMGIDYFRNQTKGDESVEKMVQNMQNAVERADTIIRGMLDLSRSDDLTLVPMDLNDVVEAGLLLVAHELKSKAISLEKDMKDDLPLVMIDRTKIQQVLINLVTNAVDAMEVEGKLQIRTCTTKLTEDHPNDELPDSDQLRAGDEVVVMETCDDGPGIPEEELRKVFEPFYTTKAQGVGTGLGLSVVRTIVNLHHGMIEIDNLKPHGARFRIFLRTTENTPEIDVS